MNVADAVHIVRLFERDARQQVLWFSGPPLAPGTVHVPIQPSHSIEYLEYLTKRKRDMIESEQPKPKRGSRSTVAPAVVRRIATLDSEETGDVDMSAVWWAQGMSAEQVADILRAIIGTA